MNDFSSFEQYLQSNQAVFQAWGKFVSAEILKQLEEKISPTSLISFLKIDAKPRVKDISSALAKVYRKNYQNPEMEMTDLVGVRFVVLLAEDIDKVCQVIESVDFWVAKVAKDFSGEIQAKPEVFDYQSKHYEIRPKTNLTLEDDLCIPQELCCEVQVRSLLQHAYAELVHDNIYKPDGIVPPQAKREVAKSMALMETTDDLFSKTLQILRVVNKPQEQLLNQLTEIYLQHINVVPDTDKKTNIVFFDAFSAYLDEQAVGQISQMMSDKKYIAPLVKEKAQSLYFFKQPVVLLIYWLLGANKLTPNEIQTIWPLPAYFGALESIFSDLDKRPRTPLF